MNRGDNIEKSSNRIYFDKKSKNEFKKNNCCGDIILIKKYHNIHNIVYLVLNYLPKVLCDMINDYIDDVININVVLKDMNSEYIIKIHNTAINDCNINEIYGIDKINSSEQWYMYTESVSLSLSTVLSSNMRLHIFCSIACIFNAFMEKMYNKHKCIYLDNYTPAIVKMYNKNNILEITYNDGMFFTGHPLIFNVLNKKLFKNVIVIIKMIVHLIINNCNNKKMQ
jgi:hypothetical protein